MIEGWGLPDLLNLFHINLTVFLMVFATFVFDHYFQIVGSFLHISQLVVAVSISFAPFVGVAAFSSDFLPITVEFHVFDVLVFRAVYSHWHFTTFLIALIVVWIFKPRFPIAVPSLVPTTLARIVPAFYHLTALETI
jgi:hypothetical protein